MSHCVTAKGHHGVPRDKRVHVSLGVIHQHNILDIQGREQRKQQDKAAYEARKLHKQQKREQEIATALQEQQRNLQVQCSLCIPLRGPEVQQVSDYVSLHCYQTSFKSIPAVSVAAVT